MKPAQEPNPMEAPVDASAESIVPMMASALSMPAAEPQVPPPPPVVGMPDRSTVRERAVQPRANRTTVKERVVPPPHRGWEGDLEAEPARELTLSGKRGTGTSWVPSWASALAPSPAIPAGPKPAAPEDTRTRLDADDEIHTRSAELTAPVDSKRRGGHIAVAVGAVLLAAGGVLLLFAMGASPHPQTPRSAETEAPTTAASLAAVAVVVHPAAGAQPVGRAETPKTAEVPQTQTQPAQPTLEANAPADVHSSPPPVQRPRPARRPGNVLANGTLEIRIRPFATVHLDGKELGQTPLAPIEVPAGRHTMRLVNKRLEKDVTRTVDVNAGEQNVFKLNLEDAE
ncbi:PEGA domain-containing protein [Corallococcus terminator]|uniref:PEGA domain-containing protein n=2 Tax=Corallococcus terminator TaxID=2316733 RepID=A0A3A8HM74_9BACT|nr:PEGA domain-containing protein [Corallococcus terminator]